MRSSAASDVYKRQVYHWGYWANEEIALGKNVTVEKDGKEK